MNAMPLSKPPAFSPQLCKFANRFFTPLPSLSPPTPLQTESESTSYHWMRERNRSAHTVIFRENAGFKNAVLPRLVGFEGIIAFSPPHPPRFFPLSSWLQMDPSPSLIFFGGASPPLPTRSHQWDDTLRPAAGINMQGDRN